MAATQACKEAIWLKTFMKEACEEQEKIVIFSDNQASMALMKNPVYHARTKHIDIQFHFVRELIEAQEVEFEYCSTHELASKLPY